MSRHYYYWGRAFPLFALLWGYNLAVRTVRQAQANRLWLWAILSQPVYWLVMRHDGLAFTEPNILFLFAVTQALAVVSQPMSKGAPTWCWSMAYC
ncbi:TraX family protein [Serratia marcescens]|uniref:TraX family protein n=1 Tax=Serratia marcescens TaxID=615 RepID=UPI001ED96450|nr:TraX family protein [Serratia marcescens]